MILYFAFLVMLFSFTSMHAGRVLLTLYAIHLGAPPLEVGILAATFSTLSMLISWKVGKLADRFGSRWTMMIGAAGGTFGMALPVLFPCMPALYAAGLMNGFLVAFSSVSMHNLVGLLSNPPDRALNFSNLTLVTSSGAFFGPLIAGFSIDHAGYASACLFTAILALVAVGLLAVQGGRLPKGAGHTPGPAGSIRILLMRPWLRRVLVASSLMMTGVSLFHFYIPIYGAGVGLSASTIGVVIGTYSAAAFIVRVALPRLIARLGEYGVLVAALFVAAAGMVLIPFFSADKILMTIAFMYGLGIGCLDPLTIMMTFNNSDTGRSGEALGVRVTANQLTGVIVPIAFGALGTTFGGTAVFILGAFLLAAGGIFHMADARRKG